jgi:hypothetical protein
MTVKILAFVKKRKDLTREQFKDYWFKEHVKIEKMVLEQTPICKIAANITVKLVPGPGRTSAGIEWPWDGIAEMYYNSMEDFQAHQKMLQEGKDPTRPLLFKDEQNFLDPSEKIVLVVEEHSIGEVKK